jgi:hypothetical protein
MFHDHDPARSSRSLSSTRRPGSLQDQGSGRRARNISGSSRRGSSGIVLARPWHSRISKMKAICAWCESEGRPSDLGEREPFYNPAATHCICAYHRKRLLELLPSKSFPDVELLIVVRPNDTALHDYLQRAFAGLRGVKVIVERRAGDRRAAQYPVADERRLVRTRRIREGEVSSLGYTVVRFTPKATTRSR